MKVQFTAEARDDLFEAADYYESKEGGLGGRFRNEVSKILSTAANAPYLWREVRAVTGGSTAPYFHTTLHT